jgi:GntR family transcriptional regulator, rspAB operon transcriptional repressor
MLLRDSIYSTLRRAILSLEFHPGQELREQVLAERYRVSRSPIRDALLRLEQEGFVTVLPRQGYRVNPISPEDVEAMYNLCLLVEPACAAGAARADDAVVATLDRFRDFDQNTDSIAAFSAYNRTFHSAIADMCGNARMAVIENNLVEEFDRLVRYSMSARPVFDVRPIIREHDAIIDAIQTHNTEKAAQLAHEHVTNQLKPVVAAFRNGVEMTEAPAELSSHVALPARGCEV